MSSDTHILRMASVAGLLMGVCACGGGSSNSSPPDQGNNTPPPPPQVVLDPQYTATAATPFVAGCERGGLGGTNFANAEVEPHFSADPSNPQRFYGAWQQDRWSTGGASGVAIGVSNDGGRSWSQRYPAFSRCAGGNAANGGDYERASDPWVTVSADGVAHAIVIAFNGAALAPGSLSSVLVSRSLDAGNTWSTPTTLVREGGDAFHDKQTMTADPFDARFVYAVWDRISSANTGPTWFARSVDGGASWEPARPIFDPGVNRQTLGNIIVVLPNGTLVNVYSQIDAVNSGINAYLDLIRSTDNGQTWSPPIRINQQVSVGTVDPETGVRVRDGSLVPSIAVKPDGGLVVAWQDSRFSQGARDAILVSHSDDGGFTWTAPVQASAGPNVAAFLPVLHVRNDGMVGMTYYDLRGNTNDRNTLLASVWLTRSTDAVTWRESQVAAAFDLDTAPLAAAGNASGYFVGDYHGLSSSGLVFIPFFARTTANAANRTDIFAAPAISATQTVAALAAEIRAQPEPKIEPEPALHMTAELSRRVSENIAGVMKIKSPTKPPLRRRRV